MVKHLFDHRCTQGGGGKAEGKHRTPRRISKDLLIHAINPKIWGPPLAIYLKALTPRDFGKDLSYTPRFSTHVHL
jgi:hypothetical protein